MKSFVFLHEATRIQVFYGGDSKSSIIPFSVQHRGAFCPVSVKLTHILTYDCHLCINANPLLLLQRMKQRLLPMAAAKYVNVSNTVFTFSA